MEGIMGKHHFPNVKNTLKYGVKNIHLILSQLKWDLLVETQQVEKWIEQRRALASYDHEELSSCSSTKKFFFPFFVFIKLLFFFSIRTCARLLLLWATSEMILSSAIMETVSIAQGTTLKKRPFVQRAN